MEVPPAGLTASLVQYRRDQPRRYVEVKLDNKTGSALDITLLGVTLPGYERPRDVNRSTHLETDRRVDLPVALADPICERPPHGTASASLRVEAAGQDAIHTTVDVDDDGLLDRLQRFDCAVRRAETAFDLELSPSWQQLGAGPDLTMRGQASATLRDTAATVEIIGINGGVLFVADAQRTDPPLPLRLDRQRPSQTLDFELLPARCDGHAVAESKRLTAVFFAVSIDDAEPVTLRRVPDDAGYQTLAAALRERCGLD
jgi:hypothetical protein